MFSKLTRRPRAGVAGRPAPEWAPSPVPETAGGRVDVADRHGLAEAPWRALSPARVLELREPTLGMLQQLPSGTDVALLTDSYLGRLRLHRRAARAGIRIERDLIVLPSTAAPIVAMDNTESAVRHFWSSVAAVPPGTTCASAPATLALLVARVAPWRFTGLLSPSRVLMGSRR